MKLGDAFMDGEYDPETKTYLRSFLNTEEKTRMKKIH